MADPDRDLESKVKSFFKRVRRNAEDVDRDTALFGEGTGLDSLETAEFAAILEDELGSDPFTTGDEMPQTVGEVIAFYEPASER